MYEDKDSKFLKLMLDDVTIEYNKCKNWLDAKAKISRPAATRKVRQLAKHYEDRVLKLQSALDRHERQLVNISKAGGLAGADNGLDEALDWARTTLEGYKGDDDEQRT